MKEICDICGGTKIVRLACRPRMTVAFQPDDNKPVPDTATSRAFPCPQCSNPTIKLETLQMVESHSTVISDAYHNKDFMRHAQVGIAHSMVNELLDRGYIKFKETPVDRHDLTFQIRAQLAVAHPYNLDNLEARIAERQEEIASLVIKEAIKEIDLWGSEYSWPSIEKSQARRMISGALHTVLKRRAADHKPMEQIK